MSWFKVDDSFDGSPKAMLAPLAAIGLWTLAGSWSSRYLTNGFIPAIYVKKMEAESEAEELVRAGLWEAVEDGWRFHDWDDFNPRADEVKERRQKRAEAGRLGGLAKARATQAPSKVLASASDLPGECQDSALANVCPVPTRPDPGEGSRSGRTKRATSLPDSWEATPAHIAYATQHGLNCAWEVEQFKSKAIAKGWTYKDWNAAFRNWLGNSLKYAQRDGLLTQKASGDSWESIPWASDDDE